MADGRRRDEWRRTARICSTLANSHRDRSVMPHPFTDDDFNPYAEPETKRPRITAPITILKAIFVPKEPPECPPHPSAPAPPTSN